MKRKISCIYIDGIEKTGKTSVKREVAKYLEQKNKKVFEMIKTENYQNHIEEQEKILKEKNNIILKEDSILNIFYGDIKKHSCSSLFLEDKYSNIIRKEREINRKFGTVMFFLIPEDDIFIKRIYKNEKPDNLDVLIGFYRGINQNIISQGFDIRLIPLKEYDKIYDVKDKILKLLEKEYFL